VDIMGVEINSDANKMTKNIGIHFKATDAWRHTFDTAINAPAEGVQISWEGVKGFVDVIRYSYNN